MLKSGNAGKVLDLLDIETGKSESSKKQILIVKQSNVKIYATVFCVLVLFGVGVLFNSEYKLNISKRDYLEEHRDREVAEAVGQQMISDLTKQLESHLVSEIKERDDTVLERDRAMEKVAKTLSDNENVLEKLFGELDTKLESALNRVPEELDTFYTKDKAAWEAKDLRQKKVDSLVGGVKAEMAEEMQKASDELKAAITPLKADVEDSLNRIMEQEKSRGNAASEHLKIVNRDMADNNMRMAAVNSRVHEHLAQDTFTTAEKEQFLKSLFSRVREYRFELAREQSDLKAEGGADLVVSPWSPELSKMLMELATQLREKKLTPDAAGSVLTDYINSNVFFPPPDDSMEIETYIDLLLANDANVHKDSEREDCSKIATCSLEAPCLIRGKCVSAPGKHGQCANNQKRCTKFFGGDSRRMAQLGKKQIMLETVAKWRGLQKTGKKSVDEIWNLVQKSLMKRDIPANWLLDRGKGTTVDDESVEGEEEKDETVVDVENMDDGVDYSKKLEISDLDLEKETKEWLVQRFLDLRNGTVTKAEMYGEVMERYNEGKIGKERMKRLSKRLGTPDQEKGLPGGKKKGRKWENYKEKKRKMEERQENMKKKVEEKRPRKVRGKPKENKKEKPARR